ncbi:MAG: hypothetical protein EVA89_18650 [Sandaracinaceae bacterium]|nr:MAG: hypothetical protein EVA89_18650 [Sandaracinaceae bacterium]
MKDARERELLLSMADGQEIPSPTRQEIETAIRELNVAGHRFAILSRGKVGFVQCYAQGDDSFDLERQEGSLDAHYEARPRVTRAQVLEAFLAYADGQPIALSVEWVPLEL